MTRLAMTAYLAPCLTLIAVGVALDACTAAQVGQAVVEGQLFCAVKDSTVAVAQASPGSTTIAPVIVKGASSEYVKAACDQIDGIAVVPPAKPGDAPTVVIRPIIIPLRG